MSKILFNNRDTNGKFPYEVKELMMLRTECLRGPLSYEITKEMLNIDAISNLETQRRKFPISSEEKSEFIIDDTYDTYKELKCVMRDLNMSQDIECLILSYSVYLPRVGDCLLFGRPPMIPVVVKITGIGYDYKVCCIRILRHDDEYHEVDLRLNLFSFYDDRPVLGCYKHLEHVAQPILSLNICEKMRISTLLFRIAEKCTWPGFLNTSEDETIEILGNYIFDI